MSIVKLNNKNWFMLCTDKNCFIKGKAASSADTVHEKMQHHHDYRYKEKSICQFKIATWPSSGCLINGNSNISLTANVTQHNKNNSRILSRLKTERVTSLTRNDDNYDVPVDFTWSYSPSQLYFTSPLTLVMTFSHLLTFGSIKANARVTDGTGF